MTNPVASRVPLPRPAQTALASAATCRDVESAAGARSWQAACHVLLVRLDNIGDVLMSTPAFDAVRSALPGARLCLLASRAGQALAPHLPMIDEVISFDAPWVAGPHEAPSGAAEQRLLDELRLRRFDAAIVFTVCTQSALPAALLCRLAGIPLRLAHSRENPYQLLSHWVKDRDLPQRGMRHEVERQLDLVRSVGFDAPSERMSLAWDERDAASMRRKLSAAGGHAGSPYVVVHPGATAASRRYPARRYGEAADLIGSSTGAQIVYAGGPGDAALVDEAIHAMGRPALSLAGQLSLGELAALIAGAAVTVCNNSAAAHIAAASASRVVVLYALTNPQHTPWHTTARVLSHEVPCRDCLRSICPEGHHRCLLGVPSTAVARAAIELAGWAPAMLPMRPPLIADKGLAA